MKPLTKAEKDELLQSLTECQCISQTIGKLGPMLRRTKPGTKRHKEIWDALTRLGNEASEHSSKIRLFLQMQPTKG